MHEFERERQVYSSQRYRNNQGFAVVSPQMSGEKFRNLQIESELGKLNHSRKLKIGIRQRQA